MLIDGTHELSGQGYPDGLDIDDDGNIWVTAPGGIYVYKLIINYFANNENVKILVKMEN